MGKYQAGGSFPGDLLHAPFKRDINGFDQGFHDDTNMNRSDFPRVKEDSRDGHIDHASV
jgi:hypothetical protein